MSVRVVARIRPLLEKEMDKDIIVSADSTKEGQAPNVVKIPNPKNEAEEFSFTFNSVYDQPTTQEELFSAEVAPHLKALFQGLDLTIFAYGVTGTGKTHTMRGGLKLAERGVIPRLLSGVFRRGKKISKDSAGEATVEVALSYYEIYNDKVFDLLEPPDKRTPSGLPLREKDGKTIVVGLSERSCEDLKDFERLYIEANNNRVTAATKLNAHSSRSHAILRVKVTQTTGDMVLESTASAIDLAGSEDNRRTDNGKERLVESAAINKSLFVLSQCIDAISRGDKRIPYRESKMTRILSLGQNNGITIMILNLAPMRSYHLDTLSSLNVSSRAKRIEVREIENEVVFKMQPPRTTSSSLLAGRQPLRPLANAHNVHTGLAAKEAKEKAAAAAAVDKPIKAFSVYTDRAKPPVRTTVTANTTQPRRSNSTTTKKRPSDPAGSDSSRPSKLAKPTHTNPSRPAAAGISAAQIEAMVERKVSEILASRAAAAAAAQPTASEPEPQSTNAVATQVSDAVARRLEALERRIDSKEHDSSSDGLRYLLQARKAKEKGDEDGALRSYEMALPFFPGQAKLLGKIERLREKIAARQVEGGMLVSSREETGKVVAKQSKSRSKARSSARDADSEDGGDGEYHYASEADADGEPEDESFVCKQRKRTSTSRKMNKSQPGSSLPLEDGPLTPKTRYLLSIVNSRDEAQIRALQGFGPKKARDLVEFLELKGREDEIESLAQLRMVPGMGGRAVERAYEGLGGVG